LEILRDLAFKALGDPGSKELSWVIARVYRLDAVSGSRCSQGRAMRDAPQPSSLPGKETARRLETAAALTGIKAEAINAPVHYLS
jgi:hypothetical protein